MSIYSSKIDMLRITAQFILLVAVVSPIIAKATGPTLSWELVNPFKFIQDQDAFDEIRRQYEKLAERTPQKLERTLQDISDEAIDVERARRVDKCRTKPSNEQQQCIDRVRTPYLGWLSGLAENNHQRTCWDSALQVFRTTKACEDYIHPVSHAIRVWVNDPISPNGTSPKWFFDGLPLSDPKDCHIRYQKGICIELTIPYNEKITHEIKAQYFDGTTASTTVRIEDRLIVGLGDSFASGEGNPDIPAQFTNGETDTDFILEKAWKKKRAPRRDRNTQVGWLDWRCHRSMYSYQFKTALHYALENPRNAVTYVSYACAGAVTDEIINTKQKPNEGGGRITIQLEALRNTLTAGGRTPRPIDYLLLSTGGNDLGFAKYVAFIVTQGLQHKLASFGVTKKKFEEAPAKIRAMLIEGDKGNYRRLNSALINDRCPTKNQPDKKCSDLGLSKNKGSKKAGIADDHASLTIKTCSDGKPCPRILLTPYPNMLYDEKDDLCTGKRHEFDVSFGPSDEREQRIKLVSDYIFNSLRNTQLEAQKEIGWTVVQRQFAAFEKHGFCAQDITSPSATAEKFEMPLLENATWSSFKPWEYRTYERRQRWFRLPIDAKLTTDQMHVILKKIRLDLIKEDDWSNIMHPTAEAHAVTAWANYQEIERLERSSSK